MKIKLTLAVCLALSCVRPSAQDPMFHSDWHPAYHVPSITLQEHRHLNIQSKDYQPSEVTHQQRTVDSSISPGTDTRIIFSQDLAKLPIPTIEQAKKMSLREYLWRRPRGIAQFYSNRWNQCEVVLPAMAKIQYKSDIDIEQMEVELEKLRDEIPDEEKGELMVRMAGLIRRVLINRGAPLDYVQKVIVMWRSNTLKMKRKRQNLRNHKRHHPEDQEGLEKLQAFRQNLNEYRAKKRTEKSNHMQDSNAQQRKRIRLAKEDLSIQALIEQKFPSNISPMRMEELTRPILDANVMTRADEVLNTDILLRFLGPIHGLKYAQKVVVLRKGVRVRSLDKKRGLKSREERGVLLQSHGTHALKSSGDSGRTDDVRHNSQQLNDTSTSSGIMPSSSTASGSSHSYSQASLLPTSSTSLLAQHQIPTSPNLSQLSDGEWWDGLYNDQ